MTDGLSIVVLGVGNTLMRDDGIGVWAIRALAESFIFPPHVRLIEGGVAGLRLLSELGSAEELLIIDAMNGGGLPGTVYHLAPEELPKARGPLMSAHDIGIVEVLSLADFLGRRPRTRILGIQPLETGSMGLQLTPPLQKALPHVVAAIVKELRALGVTVRKRSHRCHA